MIIIYRFLLILMVYLATVTYKSSNIETLLIYLPLILINYYFLKNLIDYIFCKKRKLCQKTNEFKTGSVFGFIYINILIFSIIYGFNLNLEKILKDYSLITLLYNPLIIFYLFKKEIGFFLSKKQ